MIFCQLYLQREQTIGFKTAFIYENSSNNLQGTGCDTPGVCKVQIARICRFLHIVALQEGYPKEFAASCTPWPCRGGYPRNSQLPAHRSLTTLCSVQCAVCSVQCAVCSVQCEVCSVQCAVCSVKCAVCSVQRSVQEGGCLRTASHRFCSAGLRVHRPSGPVRVCAASARLARFCDSFALWPRRRSNGLASLGGLATGLCRQGGNFCILEKKMRKNAAL